MFGISVKSDLAKMAATLTVVQRKQLPFATASALNDAARAVASGVNAGMASIFDRPTPFTQRSAFAPPALRATKSSLSATIAIRPIQAEYLALEETGGTRTPGMNTRIHAKALLGPGALRLDRFGNIPSGATGKLRKQYAEVRAARKANVAARNAAEPGAKRAAARAVYRGVVYIKGGTKQAHGRPGGFYKLSKHQLFRLTGFVARAHYQPRLHFHERAGLLALPAFRAAFRLRLAQAQKSARA